MSRTWLQLVRGMDVGESCSAGRVLVGSTAAWPTDGGLEMLLVNQGRS